MSVRSSFNRYRLSDYLDQPGVEGETYLTRAIRMGQHDAVAEFLDIGADPNAPNARGERPLYLALAQRDETAITLLLRADASVFIKKDGISFKQHALRAGMLGVAQTAAAIERREEAMRSAMSFPRGMT
ncbi:MAG TPA: ankyrin repeat domain-containing protein [Patescibacteria group bacterium]|nr:ankyrin repeat domain-containing protein [Patescibacteria group bacterium]